MTAVEKVTMHTVIAFQIAGSIDIKRFRVAYDRQERYQDSTEVYYVESGKCLYVLAYGVVAFEGYNDEGMNEAIAFIKPFCRTLLEAKLREEFVIHERPRGGERFGHNDADLTRVDPDVLRIVMLNVAQSVAMDYFTQQADALLEETNKHTLRLEREGRTGISGKPLIRHIGRTLNMKNRIAQNLYILDSPEETWDDEYLSTIDSALKRTFEINARHKNIELELQLVKDNLEVVKDLVYHRESKVLEWIVIALILVEVLNLFFEKLLKTW